MRARDNPFAVSKVLKVRYIPQSTTWDEILNRLELLKYRAAIQGPEGSGKTTLLEDLSALLSKRFEIRLYSISAEAPSADFKDVRPNHFVMLDGIDWLPYNHQKLLLQVRCAGLLITTHHAIEERRLPAGTGLRRHLADGVGWKPTIHNAARMAALYRNLPVLIHCTTSPDLLEQINAALLGSEAGEIQRMSRKLFFKHQGNLRDVLREFYDLWAER